MKSKAKMFVSAFVITCIAIGAMCGFILVDLSTDRYMPRQFPHMLEVSGASPDAFAFSLMGYGYSVSAERLIPAVETLSRHRGLIPAHIRVAGAAASACMRSLQQESAPQENMP